MKFEGRVTSGLGQGAQFLALDWVATQLREKLGLAPFPGTLNLRVAPQERESFYARRHEFTKITHPASPDCPGYVKRVTLRAKGKSADAYLILPEKSQYDDVLEIIAASRLRDFLAVHDGDPVEIIVEIEA